jgi:hypothetical protein
LSLVAEFTLLEWFGCQGVFDFGLAAVLVLQEPNLLHEITADTAALRLSEGLNTTILRRTAGMEVNFHEFFRRWITFAVEAASLNDVITSSRLV